MGLEVGQNGLYAAADGEFLINVMQVSFDCLDRNAQLIGNFFIAPTSGGAHQDFSLSIGQAKGWCWVFLMGLSYCARNGTKGMVRYERCQDALTSNRSTDNAKKICLISILQDIAKCTGLHGSDDP